MNRHERRMQQRTTGRRERTPQELDEYITRLIGLVGEQFAFLAWDGYQRLGRGCVMASEVHGAVFCSRADLHTFPIHNQTAVLRLIDTYIPTEQVLVAALLPETPDLYEHMRAFIMFPEIAPPQAQADPMITVARDEPRH